MSNIEFYFAPNSSASRIHWALEELGVPVTKHQLALGPTGTKSPEHLARHPSGKVPVLVVDGQRLFESTAILAYLAFRYGEATGLWPAANDPARLEALSWTMWSSTELAAAAVAHLRAREDKEALAELHDRFARVEAQLADRDFVLGAGFSLADVALAAAVGWLQWEGVDLSAFPRVLAWAARCDERPAAKRTQALENPATSATSAA